MLNTRLFLYAILLGVLHLFAFSPFVCIAQKAEPIPFKTKDEFYAAIANDAVSYNIYVPISLLIDNHKIFATVPFKSIIHFIANKRNIADTFAKRELWWILESGRSLRLSDSEPETLKSFFIDSVFYQKIIHFNDKKILKRYFHKNVAFKENITEIHANTIMYLMMTRNYEFQNASLIGLPVLMNFKTRQ